GGGLSSSAITSVPASSSCDQYDERPSTIASLVSSPAASKAVSWTWDVITASGRSRRSSASSASLYSPQAVYGAPSAPGRIAPANPHADLVASTRRHPFSRAIASTGVNHWSTLESPAMTTVLLPSGSP